MRDLGPWLGSIALLFAFAVPTARAQWNTGHLEDASTQPKGLLRLRAASVWTRYDERFTTNGTTPLGALFTADSLGSNRLAELGTIESEIATAAGSPFTLSLGRGRLSATGREDIVPVVFEYGLTNRLAIGLTIPVVRKRVAPQFRLDTAGGYVANVGPNPARTLTAAATSNQLVQTQFSGAAAQLQNRLNSCNSNPSAAGCAALLARQAEALALIASSQSFAAAVGSVYGSSSWQGSAFVPVTASAAQAAIATRVSGFNTQYKDLLATTSDLITQVPVGAAGPAGVDAFNDYLTELRRDTISLQERVYVGDVEVGAKYLAIDRRQSATRKLGLQVAVAASWHMPTGTKLSGSEIVDLRTTEDEQIIDLRAFVDARFARFGMLASARQAFGQRLELANPSIPKDPIEVATPFTNSTSWTEVNVAPRWHFSGPLAIHAAWSIRSTDKQGGDQLAGAGFSFITLDRYDGRTLPVEMRYTHLEAISGDAGRPRLFRDQIELRLYYRLRKR